MTFPHFNQPAPVEEDIVAALEEQIDQGIEAQSEEYKRRKLANIKSDAKVEEELNRLRRIVPVRASSITPENQRWLWAPGAEGYGRIPMGELTLIVGRGGVGKSTLLCTMCAWITIGDMQGEFEGTPKDVLYVANEDSLKRTVVPRLMAAGADLDRVHFLEVDLAGQTDRVMLPSDCEAIGEYANEVGAVAMMLDPLSSNLRVDNPNDAKKMRTAIEAVRKAAETYDIAAMGLAHTRKAESRNLMDAIMGSVELGNVCRSAMGVMRDDEREGVIVLSQEKLNVGRLDIPSYEYHIEDAEIRTASSDRPINTSRLQFIGKSDKRVSDMLADQAAMPGVGKSALNEAKEFLLAHLAGLGGEGMRGEVIQAAQKDGHARATVDKAARVLNLGSRASGKGASKIWFIQA